MVSNLASNAINRFQRKISGKGVVRSEKVFTLFISNEDINDIIKIIKSGVLTDGVTETVKHEIKKQDGWFLPALLAPFDTSVVQPVISMSGSGVRRARKGYGNKDT